MTSLKELTATARADALDFFQNGGYSIWSCLDSVLEKWRYSLSDELSTSWVEFILRDCPHVIDKHFDHVGDKQWLHQLLVAHPVLLVPLAREIYLGLSDEIGTALKEEFEPIEEEAERKREQELGAGPKGF